jgi:hypothetical protein
MINTVRQYISQFDQYDNFLLRINSIPPWLADSHLRRYVHLTLYMCLLHLLSYMSQLTTTNFFNLNGMSTQID